MEIDEQIEYLKTKCKEDIDALLPKDRLNYFQVLTEYQRPKMQRAGFTQDGDAPTKIEIEIVK